MSIQELSAQFSGFTNTPHLFKNSYKSFTPFLKTTNQDIRVNTNIPTNTRLGKRVESFVSQELKHINGIEILSENKQVNDGKITIGELDCLLLDNNEPIHLEIQYKFYLYDPKVGTTEVDHFIGPMRKDSLTEKLNKLSQKQFPLLHNTKTAPFLNDLGYCSTSFNQQIYFKAQLYLPYKKEVTLNILNTDCIYGFYINYNDLEDFKNHQFYIPKKIDWLVDVNTTVNWSSYKDITPQLLEYQLEKWSPLVWLKAPNGDLQKCFIVAWDS